MALRKYNDLTRRQRSTIYCEWLEDPSQNKLAFCTKHNIYGASLNKMENTEDANGLRAVEDIMEDIMKKDIELLQISTDIKHKWAIKLRDKTVITTKEIDSLDKVENAAMKRALILKANADSSKEKGKPLEISITL